ncbi:MAG: hypothetical protein GY800_14000 [Planctomycetes bacterium]|nr:hypothetical protein [Planctomycetota bacterium]
MTIVVEKDRNRRGAEIVKQFICLTIFYRKLFSDYQKGSLRFDDVQELVDDKGQSLLFNLKKNCQLLFRNNEHSTDQEILFDLAIGSIFHEAMLVRENCYQLEVYMPKVSKLKEKVMKTSHEKKFLREVNHILSRARKRLAEELKETNTLIENTSEQLKDLLSGYSENGLLIRFLLEEEELVEDALGRGSVDGVLSSMYKGGRLEGLIVAARSYYKSGFNAKAKDMANRALTISPDEDIRFLHLFYSGMTSYYERDLNGALECFEQARKIAGNTPEYKEGLEKIESIASKITALQHEGA